MIDHSRKSGVTFNVISAHSNFSEDIQIEKMVDGSGQPDERDSSNAQIRTVLDEQMQMTIAEYCEKIGHHELQAARAEEERRILQEELWRQQKEFREVHQQDLMKMKELQKFQNSTSIRSQDENSSRTRTLLWSYQAEYRNCKMK